MKKLARLLTMLTLTVISVVPSSAADNPFPGVPYDGEIPGYTVEVNCGPGGDNSSSGVDCGIGIVPYFDCPQYSSADGRNGYANDGPPGDPHKKVGVARRFCRNSWSPPTSAADDEDFRNRQQLAMAAATLESQAYSASHPGEQKCVTWGPIVHANGISTASGGVCANVVGVRPDGTTGQVPPTQLGSSNSDQGSAQNVSNDSATSTVDSRGPGSSTASRQIDLTQFGFGKPFTRILAGNISPGSCPDGFQAATNPINTGVEYGATECWPANAWAAYSIGGDVWSQFKTSNGSINAEAEAARRIQVNAIRTLALQQAQQLANQTIGLKRCASWSGFGESGQECAYIPIQNNLIGGIVTTSSGDTSTSQIKKATEVIVSKFSSKPGQSQSEWEKSESYTAFSCPGGTGKALSIDLNGTISKSDDVWTLSCIKVMEDPTYASDSSTIISIPKSETFSASAASSFSQLSNKQSDSTTAISSDTVDFKGTVPEILALAQNLSLPKSESQALQSTLSRLVGLKQQAQLVKVILPSSPILTETVKTLTPNVCKVSGVTVIPKKTGVCQVSYILEGESGNSFEATKKLTFKK